MSSHRGGFFRRVLWIASAGTLAAVVALFVCLGTILSTNDPLQHADAIYVLAGSRMERALEAAEIFKERWAPLIVLSTDAPDAAELYLAARGVHVPRSADIIRDALTGFGVPDEAIVIPAEAHTSTAHEAHTLRALATDKGWHRVIVVTSKLHTRRSAFAMRRELEHSGIEIIIRGSRFDRSQPARWWRNRRDISMTVSEAQKFVAYFLGLGM
jgi:uncharacterized SAM-binding protein YcdF (DUF218 family)